MDLFLEQVVNGLTLGSLYALIAVGYTVVYGIVQLINFAHGEVFMIGAFGGLSTYLLLFEEQTSLWILPVMLVGAIISAVVVAMAMERVAYRPLRNAPRLAPLITAIGVSVFLQEFVRLMYDRPWWTVPVMALGAAGLGFGVGVVVAGRQGRSASGSNRTLLIGAVVAVIVAEAIYRAAAREVSILVSLALVVGAVVLGAIVVAGLAGLLTDRPARSARLFLAPLAAAGSTALLAEVGWWLYQDVLRTAGFPSAKQRIPFPQINVVTGPALEPGGVTIQRSAVFTVAALLLCSVLLWYFVNRTRLGRAMQAVSQDPDTARLMGINVDRIIVIAFAMGATLAAVAGISQGFQNNNIEFQMGFLGGLKAFTAAVLGGIGNIQGAVVGGLALGMVEAMAVQYIPGQFGGSSWKDVWAFAILILVLVFRPQGLMGARVVDRA